ncbi:MAG: DNA replication/repair protein RecF [Devosiaceae bacterium]|nr:DNA replication/repair protein RecF [Devosiaceae bacterium]
MCFPTRYISRVRLTNFRNFANAALDCDQRHIVLCGANGSGKTNFLEAISLFSAGRGLRRAPFSNMLKNDLHINDNNDWAIAISLDTQNGPIDMGTGSFGKQDGRIARINGVNAKSIIDMSEYIRLLWLSPDMDSIFRGSASERRRFFDRLVSTLIPDHNSTLNFYEKAVRSRNKLLENGADEAWLDAVEAQMAQYAGAIYFSRIDCLGHLQLLLDENIDQLAFPNSHLALSALFEDGHEPNSSSALEFELIKYWKNSRNIDRAAKRTLLGPHRVDFLVTHKQKSMPAALCSTGEQKALLIGLVLSHARLVKKMTGITPILLLDEIGAHLDIKRREALFLSLDELETQCFMSGTDKIFFSALGKKAMHLKIDDGQIIVED